MRFHFFIIISALLALTSITSAAQDEIDPNIQERLDRLLPHEDHFDRNNDYKPEFPDSEPTIFACYVRSSKGKLYGPGKQQSSLKAARKIALQTCARMTGANCKISYCVSH